MTRRTDVQLLAIERQHQNLARVLADTLTHLARTLDHHDGYPTHTPGASPPTATGHEPEQDPVDWTTTERAGNHRTHIAAQAADLNAGLHLLAATYHDMVNTCHTILRGATPDTPPRRCDANGRDGCLEWGDFTCDALPVAHGLCDRCYRRERRWRKDHGLADRSAA